MNNARARFPEVDTELIAHVAQELVGHAVIVVRDLQILDRALARERQVIAVDGGRKLHLREFRDEELLHRGLRGEVFHHELIRTEIREFVAALEVPRILNVIEVRVEDLF